MTSNDPYGFEGQLRGYSIEQLVGTFNREVGNPGWVAARGVFLAALRDALLNTGLDCSGFIRDGSMSLRHQIRPEGRSLVPVSDTESKG